MYRERYNILQNLLCTENCPCETPELEQLAKGSEVRSFTEFGWCIDKLYSVYE